VKSYLGDTPPDLADARLEADNTDNREDGSGNEQVAAEVESGEETSQLPIPPMETADTRTAETGPNLAETDKTLRRENPQPEVKVTADSDRRNRKWK